MDLRNDDGQLLFPTHLFLFGSNEWKNDMDWMQSLSWPQVMILRWIKRDWFPNELFWKQSTHCAGFVVSSQPCNLRAGEMNLLMYTPSSCLDGEFEGCNQLIAYARLSIKAKTEEEAMLQFATTIFTCIILATGSIMFSNDTQYLIIMPITKMVGIIKTLADDPLQKQAPQFDEEEHVEKGQMKTIELQKTIYRIGNLLQMSFGQLGAIIIREQVSSGDGNLEIMIPGQKITAIFMVCKINQFVDYTEVLKTNLTDFLNKITQIMHHCAFRWDGWANKTNGDSYLITWKLPDIETNSNDHERNESLQEQRTELADKSLIAAIKIVSEIRRANQFNVYFRKNQMVQRFGTMTRPYITFGLHLGWSIQGAIGSDNKIDASYLSPHQQIARRFEELTATYDMQILLSEALYNYMSLKARNTLRKIDVIMLNTFTNQALQNQQEPMGVYTFDMSFKNLEVTQVSEDHEVGDLIKLQKYETINIESFKNKGVDYMFTLDSDIVGLQEHIQEFNPIFRQAFKHYIGGDWGAAYEHIDRCLELWENDGPTKSLQLFMSYYNFQAPSDWANCRNIDLPINQEEINRELGIEGVEEDEMENTGKVETADVSSR